MIGNSSNDYAQSFVVVVTVDPINTTPINLF